jgi:hypothetical protein
MLVDMPEPRTTEMPGKDGVYDENGIDRSLIRWMLSLTPTERLAVVQGSIDLVQSVRRRPDVTG